MVGELSIKTLYVLRKYRNIREKINLEDHKITEQLDPILFLLWHHKAFGASLAITLETIKHLQGEIIVIKYC